jgi:outer membrane protein
MKVYHFFFALMTISINYLYSQTKIKCDLISVSNIAFNKSPILKSSYYAIQDAEANLQVQNGAFDFNLNSALSFQNNSYTLFNADPRNKYIDRYLKSNSIELSTGLQKRFRSSQIVEFSLKYGYNNSNFPFNNFNEYVGSFYGNHSGTINFSLTQPLLKGRGKEITTLSEKVSSLHIDKNKYDYEFTNSYEILQIGIAYWNYYTAFKNLDVYTQNENRVRNLLEITKELIKADKKPASDLAQVNADFTNQERLTVMARQSLYNTRLNLGRAIGLTDEESQQLDDPLNDFPVVAETGYEKTINKSTLIKNAKENRGDLKAIKKNYEAVELQYKLAENNLRPQLDLTGFAFYGSASIGNGVSQTLSSFTNDQGQNIGGGAKLTFSFPLNNNLAKGNYLMSKIALSDQEVINENTLRNIELNINIALNNLHNSVLILEKAKESLVFHQEAFNNEQIKFKTGLTTLLDLMLFQERLTFSELEYLGAQQQFSNAIINLRHETGTLISQDNLGFTLTQNVFYTVPNITN